MSRDCLPSLPSASKPWLAAGAMLFYLLGFHLLLPEPAPGRWQPALCPQPCCLYRLPAVSASRSVFPIAASVNQ